MAYIPTPTTKDLSILDPELKGVIQLLPTTVETAESAQVVINFMRAAPPRPQPTHTDVDKVDLLVSAENAAPGQPPTSIRMHIPRQAVQEKGKLPVVIWSHHGGFWSAGPLRLDAFCSDIAHEAGVVVVAPAYRQTPEHHYPAQFDDVYQVILWTASAEAARYHIDSTRLCVGGTSAGGTLAVGTTLKYVHEHPSKPSPIKLLALEDASYTDASTSYSTFHNPVNKIWNANVTRYMWELYLPQGSDSLEDRERGWVVPLKATDEQLKSLPSTIIMAAQWDDLTNDAIKFAWRLLEVGVPAEIHTYRGTFHVSDKLMHDAKCSVKKRADLIDALKAAFRA